MKRKIGELRNVPIVEGDKNLVRGGAEIHINDLQTNNSSSGSSSKYAPRYFSINWDKVDNPNETWNRVFEYGDDTYMPLQCFSTLKWKPSDVYVISTCGTDINKKKIAFSYIPCYVPDFLKNGMGLPHSGILSFEQCIECINAMLSQLELPILTLNGITEITEEEFYTI